MKGFDSDTCCCIVSRWVPSIRQARETRPLLNKKRYGGEGTAVSLGPCMVSSCLGGCYCYGLPPALMEVPIFCQAIARAGAFPDLISGKGDTEQLSNDPPRSPLTPLPSPKTTRAIGQGIQNKPSWTGHPGTFATFDTLNTPRTPSTWHHDEHDCEQGRCQASPHVAPSPSICKAPSSHSHARTVFSYGNSRGSESVEYSSFCSRD